MAVSAASVTVPSNTATVIVPATNANARASAPRPTNVSVALTNLSANICFIGGSTVSGDSNGYRLQPGASITLSVGMTDVIYGRSAVNSALIGYIATG